MSAKSPIASSSSVAGDARIREQAVLRELERAVGVVETSRCDDAA